VDLLWEWGHPLAGGTGDVGPKRPMLERWSASRCRDGPREFAGRSETSGVARSCQGTAPEVKRGPLLALGGRKGVGSLILTEKLLMQ
jgi:hypothetical protein